jgi:dethiobiotin synthetase
VTLHLDVLAAEVRSAQAYADLVLVELAGGLFTPLTATELNADFAARLRPDFLLLVAADRLGVLHDVLATTRAAEAAALRIHGIVLVTPERADASTGTNGAELAAYTPISVLGAIPRASSSVLANDPSVLLMAEAIRR